MVQSPEFPVMVEEVTPVIWVTCLPDECHRSFPLNIDLFSPSGNSIARGRFKIQANKPNGFIPMQPFRFQLSEPGTYRLEFRVNEDPHFELSFLAIDSNELNDDIALALEGIDHAREHMDELKRRTRKFIKSGAYGVIRDRKPKGNTIEYSFRFQVREAIPNKWRFLFGDAIHGLRAPCDHLINALGAKYGFNPNSRLEFPVSTQLGTVDITSGNGDGFAKWRFDKKRFPIALLDVLEKLQPFNPYTTSRGNLVNEHHPLRILHDFWNRDKHKARLVVTAVNPANLITYPGFASNVSASGGSVSSHSSGVSFQRDGGPMEVIFDVVSTAGQVVEDGTVFATVTLPISGDPNDIKTPFVVQVTLDKDSEVAPCYPAYPLLVDLHDFVRNEIITRLVPFL